MGAPGTTPGPWAVSKTASRRVTANGIIICNAVLRNSGSAKRGIRHGAKLVAEAEANACQIAAAPKMYDALVAVEEAVRQLLRNHTHSVDGAHYAAMDAVEEALAAARGEA